MSNIRDSGKNIYVSDRVWPSEMTEMAYEAFKYYEIPTASFYIEKYAIESNIAKHLLLDYFPDYLADFILGHLRKILSLVGLDINSITDGIEFWVGKTLPKVHVVRYLHVDSDEELRLCHDIINNPLVGSILYLGPTSGILGGETIFLPKEKIGEIKLFRHYHDEEMLKISGAEVVRPIEGRCVYFTGDAPHAVLSFTLAQESEPRMTLLANCWEQRISSVPFGISKFTPLQYAELIQNK